MVGERYVVEQDMIFRILMIPGFQQQVLRSVQYLTDPIRGGRTFGKQHKHTVDGKHGVQDDRKVSKKSQDGSRLCLTGSHPESSRHNHQRKACVQEKIHQRIAGSHCNRSFCLFLHDVLVCSLETFFFVFCFGKRFDDTDSGGVLPYDTDHPVNRLLQLCVQGNSSSGNIKYGHCDKRQDSQKNQRQYRFHEHGHGDTAKEQDRRADSQPLHHTDHLVNVVGIRSQAGFQGSDGERVRLAAGQIRNPVEQIVPETFSCIPCHPGSHPVGNDVTRPGDHRTDQHKQTVKQDFRHVFFGNDHIDHIGKNPREKQIHDRSGEFDRHTEDHPRNVRAQIEKYLFQAETTPLQIILHLQLLHVQLYKKNTITKEKSQYFSKNFRTQSIFQHIGKPLDFRFQTIQPFFDGCVIQKFFWIFPDL